MASNASAISAPRARSVPTSLARAGAFVALTKPRIIELLLVTTVPTMVVAAGGWPSLRLVVATLVGGTLSAGGANAANMYLDRDIDALMRRTSRRPLVTGVNKRTGGARRSPSCLEAAAFLTLWFAVNPLSAVLALSAALFYVFVYTAVLKRRSPQNIVIGGAAGAVPVLVGWAAVQGSLGWAPLVALRFGVPVDAAALLGSRHPLPGRLCQRQRADDAGRGEPGAHRAGNLRCTRWPLSRLPSSLAWSPICTGSTG